MRFLIPLDHLLTMGHRIRDEGLDLRSLCLKRIAQHGCRRARVVHRWPCFDELGSSSYTPLPVIEFMAGFRLVVVRDPRQGSLSLIA